MADPKALDILQQYFGYSGFRAGQEELIEAQLAGRDAIGVMPTGGGKSLCYQIPALIFDGITLVVSPLISLMKDQVAALKNAGIPAAYINSSLSPEQISAVYRNILNDRYKIIYVAPERLLNAEFLAAVSFCRVSLLAVDEAHCISQWGQDFRPSYLRIADFLAELGSRPVVSAFTATATPQVRADIEHSLGLRDSLRITTGFDRPNLRFEVLRPKNKLSTLKSLLLERNGRSGIIYCATRKNVEQICQALIEAGIPATKYHAGLSDDERRGNQDAFIYDRRPVMVATNAFGMGIDKSNVSYVIHYNMPQSIEAYYQEAGRAGRDGAAADCILLYSPGDIKTAEFLITRSSPGPQDNVLSDDERDELIDRDLTRLNIMVAYCKTTSCLRGYILDYFGEAHKAQCGNCRNCAQKFVERDITTEAKMILSCVRRISDKLGYPLGAVSTARVLRGSRDRRIVELGLDELTTYGLMKSVSRTDLNDMIEALTAQGYIHIDPDHGGAELTASAGDVLFRSRRVTMTVRAAPEPVMKRLRRAIAPAADGGLLVALKTLRLRLASEENLPAYIIFSNSALQDMASKRPTTMAEFLEVSGVGKYKAERYGQAFLDEIRRYTGK